MIRNIKKKLSKDLTSVKVNPSLMVNALSNWAALFVYVIIGFFLTPYIIKNLGTAQYGIWALIITMVGYYGLLDLGVTSAIMRYVARYAGQKDNESLNEIVNTSIAIFISLGLLVVIISIFIAGPLANFFNIESEYITTFKYVVWLLAITAGFNFIGTVLSVVILAHERFVIVNIIKINIAVLRGILCFIVLYKGGKLLGLSWVNLMISLFIIAANLAIIRKRFPHVQFSLKMINKSKVTTLLSFGFFTFITKIGNLLRLKLDAAVIGRFMNMDSVGIYNIGVLLFGYIRNINIALSGVTQPRLATIAGKGNNNNFGKSYLKYSNFVASLTAGIGLVSFLIVQDFLPIWLPDNFKDIHGASVVFFLLLAGLMPDLMSNVSGNALQAVKKHHYLSYQTVLEGAINLTLSILLVSRYGIYGVALGTAIPALITKLIVQPIFCCRILRINYWKYMLSVFIKPLLIFGCIYLSYRFSGLEFFETSISLLMIKGLLLLIVYSVIVYIFGLDKENKRSINLQFRLIINRLK